MTHPRASRDRFALLAVLALALTNVLLQLGTQSLFVDEGATWLVESGPAGGLIQRVRDSEVAPPLYYALLHGWTRVLGTQDELALRLPSALCAVLAVLVVVRIGTTLVSRAVGLWAGLLLALSPSLPLYGQLARAYAPVLLTSAIALLALVEMRREPGRRWQWVFGVACVLGLLLHYTAALVVGPLLASFALDRRISRVARFAVLAPCAAAVVADGLLAVHQTGTGRSDHSGAGFSLSSFGQVVGVPFAGRGVESWPSVVGALLLLLALTAVLVRGNRELRLLAVAGALPVLAVVLATASGHRAMWGRYVVVALPFLVVAVVAAASRQHRLLPLVPVALALVGSGLSHRPDYSYYGDVRGLVATAGRGWQPSDAIADLNGYRPLASVVDYYVASDLPHGTPTLSSPVAVTRALGQHHRVWVITTHAGPGLLRTYFAELHGRVIAVYERPGASRPDLVLVAPSQPPNP